MNVKSEADFEIARTPTNGLEVDCRIELDQIQPIHHDWIIAKVGKLSAEEWEGIMKQLFWNVMRNE